MDFFLFIKWVVGAAGTHLYVVDVVCWRLKDLKGLQKPVRFWGGDGSRRFRSSINESNNLKGPLDRQVESMTKYVSGGRCIGGAVLGPNGLMAPILSWMLLSKP